MEGYVYFFASVGAFFIAFGTFSVYYMLHCKLSEKMKYVRWQTTACRRMQMLEIMFDDLDARYVSFFGERIASILRKASSMDDREFHEYVESLKAIIKKHDITKTMKGK